MNRQMTDEQQEQLRQVQLARYAETTRQMTETKRERRRQVRHARYVRKREEILAKQKVYRDTHKAEIAAKRRQRDFEKKYLQKPRMKRERKEIDHEYYMAHREEILAR